MLFYFNSPSPQYWRRGFTLVELLVVIAIIGVLIALLLPAVQQAREAARRMECTNNQKQIGLALHNFHDTHGQFPSGGEIDGDDACSGSKSRARAPWTVRILPYMEQNSLYEQFDLTEKFPWGWDDAYETPDPDQGAVNQGPAIQVITAYHCPSNPLSDNSTPVLDYLGVMGGGTEASEYKACSSSGFGGSLIYNNGILYSDSKTGFRDIIDGTTNSFMVGESIYFKGPNSDDETFSWASGWVGGKSAPSGCATVRGINSGPDVLHETEVDLWADSTGTFGSVHPGGALFLLGDASVQFVPETIEINIYRQLGIRNDALPVGGLP
ncbi:DUF1559 domain-containing protein [Blastopirellula sp. J2-11]|uniref:DUF1559 domain-containing protein n=1 Tax=Blastopirellula sp. J2-11 TaxID=2943192 RepID=UPI0021C58B5A|nr:DUF1559 domain-containing protein [Blastopirellula sp. J2-11]UUO07370.1 DUF1559 domain-containing protein [Blastopirellula sp. J2-11]